MNHARQPGAGRPTNNASPVGPGGALFGRRLVWIPPRRHMVPGTQRGCGVVVDPEPRLATVVEVWSSGYTDKREVQRQIDYGYVEEGGREAPHDEPEPQPHGRPRPQRGR